MNKQLVFRFLLVFSFVGAFFLTISHSGIPTYAQTTTTPPFFPLAPCPTCGDPSISPVVSGVNLPSGSVENPPSVDPCVTSDTALASHKSRHHSRHNGGISNFMQMIMQFFLELINMLLKLLGGAPIEIPSTNPGLNPSTAPYPLPTSANTDPVPCPPTGQPNASPTQPVQQPSQTQPTTKPLSGTPPSGTLSVKVSGNKFVNQNNQTIRLLGVNRSGTQYMCYGGGEIFDGPNDDASIQSMKAWGITAVRVNLNEHCWLGLSDVQSGFGGAPYQQAIGDYVKRLNSAGLYVIVDMHHSGPGLNSAGDMQKMADRDHATAYWTSVAGYFKNNAAVLFDLYNEPHPDTGNATADWTCIRDGGTCQGITFVTEGMQQMLNAVRATGATNPVLIGGPEYAGTLDQWLQFKPTDPANQLVASVHIYGKPLGSPYDDPATWDTQIAPLSQQVPIVMGEIGDSDCTHKFIDQLMPWADQHGISYFGWGWVTSDCADEPALITNYNGTSTNYGIGLRTHLLSLPK